MSLGDFFEHFNSGLIFNSVLILFNQIQILSACSTISLNTRPQISCQLFKYSVNIYWEFVRRPVALLDILSIDSISLQNIDVYEYWSVNEPLNGLWMFKLRYLCEMNIVNSEKSDMSHLWKGYIFLQEKVFMKLNSWTQSIIPSNTLIQISCQLFEYLLIIHWGFCSKTSNSLGNFEYSIPFQNINVY